MCQIITENCLLVWVESDLTFFLFLQEVLIHSCAELLPLTHYVDVHRYIITELLPFGAAHNTPLIYLHVGLETVR